MRRRRDAYEGADDGYRRLRAGTRWRHVVARQARRQAVVDPARARGSALPLLDDSYIGVIAQRAYIYWVLSAGPEPGRRLSPARSPSAGCRCSRSAPTPRRRWPPAASGRSGIPISRWRRAASCRRGIRRHRRPARAAAAHLLLRHDDAWASPPSSPRWRSPGRTSPAAASARRARPSPGRSSRAGASTISASSSRRSRPG